MSYASDLRSRKLILSGRATAYESILEEGRMTAREREDFDNTTFEIRDIETKLAGIGDGVVYDAEPGNKRNGRKAMKHDDRVEGKAIETLDSKQSMSAWVDRAAKNGVEVRSVKSGRPYRMTDSSFDTNAYWGQRMGFAGAGAEVRALGEDTVGSGQAITPQSWSAQFIDYLYPATLLGQLGATKVPMTMEQVNVPQLTAPVSPQWVAENAATSLDANPAFSTLPLFATGMFYDITLFSMEMAQDAYVQGGLPGMLAESASRNFAVAIDKAGFYGVAGNTGNPGFSNESGVQLRKYAGHSGTTGQAPADTQEYSMLAELVRNKNVEPTAYATSPQLMGTIDRLNAGSYAKFWDMPNHIPATIITSTSIPVTETDPASGVPAQTAGSYTSLYCADWSRVLIGTHLDLQTTVLKERYADQLQIGLLTYMRFSIRLSHPEAFVRSYGAVAV